MARSKCLSKVRRRRSGSCMVGLKRGLVRLESNASTLGGAVSPASIRISASSNEGRRMSGRATRVRACFVLGLGLQASFCTTAYAQSRGPDAGAPSLQATARATKAFRPPLQPLPRMPSRRLAAPTAADREILKALLERLTSSNAFDRESALADLRDLTENMLPAVRAQIDSEAETANRAGMKQTLLDMRHDVRGELEREQRAAGKTGEVETPDYLEMVLARPRPQSKEWRQLVNVLALSRICVAIGTVSAVRQLIHVFVRFEFLRIDTQLQLAKLDENALAALIESTRHPAPAVAEWAKRRLDFMGEAIPSEAV